MLNDGRRAKQREKKLAKLKPGFVRKSCAECPKLKRVKRPKEQ